MVEFSEIREYSVDELKRELLEIWDTIGITDPLYHGNGSLPGLLYESVPRIANKLTRMAVASKVLTLGELAEGEALDLWSWSVYRHERKPSTPYVYYEQLTCAAGSGPHSFTEGSVVVASAGSTYRLSAPPADETWPVTLSAGQFKVFEVTCETQESATVTGRADLGAINRMVTTYLGVTCTNTAMKTKGERKETDDQLRMRNRTIWATLNQLALVADAYVYHALNASAGVRRVRVLDDNPRGMYTLDLVLAGSEGGVGQAEVDEVRAAIQKRVLKPFFDRIDIYPANVVAVSPRGSVYYYADFELQKVRDAITAALADLAADLPIGGSSFEGYGANCLLRAQVEKAIETTRIDGKPCVKLAPLSYPPVVMALNRTDAVSITPTYSATGLNLIPVTE